MKKGNDPRYDPTLRQGSDEEDDDERLVPTYRLPPQGTRDSPQQRTQSTHNNPRGHPSSGLISPSIPPPSLPYSPGSPLLPLHSSHRSSLQPPRSGHNSPRDSRHSSSRSSTRAPSNRQSSAQQHTQREDYNLQEYLPSGHDSFTGYLESALDSPPPYSLRAHRNPRENIQSAYSTARSIDVPLSQQGSGQISGSGRPHGTSSSWEYERTVEAVTQGLVQTTIAATSRDPFPRPAERQSSGLEVEEVDSDVYSEKSVEKTMHQVEVQGAPLTGEEKRRRSDLKKQKSKTKSEHEELKRLDEKHEQYTKRSTYLSKRINRLNQTPSHLASSVHLQRELESLKAEREELKRRATPIAPKSRAGRAKQDRARLPEHKKKAKGIESRKEDRKHAKQTENAPSSTSQYASAYAPQPPEPAGALPPPSGEYPVHAGGRAIEPSDDGLRIYPRDVRIYGEQGARNVAQYRKDLSMGLNPQLPDLSRPTNVPSLQEQRSSPHGQPSRRRALAPDPPHGSSRESSRSRASRSEPKEPKPSKDPKRRKTNK